MSKRAEILLIEGPDARAFAHAQFSSQVNSLVEGHWQFSAWLSAQGRVRAFFHLARLAEDKYLLLLRGGPAAPMADALQRFVFRSKLTISALAPGNLLEGPALAMHAANQSSKGLLLGCDTHSLQITNEGEPDEHGWSRLQLLMGWPWLHESALDELLPGALSLQRLHAVAVDKGCYPGQEIVARLHFRGGQKRHLHSGTLSQSLVPGFVLRSKGREVGCVLNVIDDDVQSNGLLVLTDDIAAQVNEGPQDLFDDNVQVHIDNSWPA